MQSSAASTSFYSSEMSLNIEYDENHKTRSCKMVQINNFGKLYVSDIKSHVSKLLCLDFHKYFHEQLYNQSSSIGTEMYNFIPLCVLGRTKPAVWTVVASLQNQSGSPAAAMNTSTHSWPVT